VPTPVAAEFTPATGFVENCDRSNLDFMGRFLPPRKGFALHRTAEGAFTVQFGDAQPVPLPEHDLANLRAWRNATHPQVRITGVGDGAKLLDAPVSTKPAPEPTATAAGMSW
jgi:hypothetical protein